MKFAVRTLESFLVASLTIVSLTACRPTASLANRMLYPYRHANKTHAPERVTDGYAPLLLKEGKTAVSVWYYEDTDAPNAPAVIYFHGNGENIASLAKGGFLTDAASLDAHVVVLDYPFYGQSVGELDEKGLVNAGEIVFRWVKTRFPGSRIVIWGRSLGSAVAIQVALKNQAEVSKLILGSPWETLKKLVEVNFLELAKLVPRSWYEANEYDSTGAARQIRIPTLIHHGEVDNIVPFDMGKKLAESFPPGVAIFRPVPGASHNDLLWNRAVWDDIYKFIQGQPLQE